jgi:multidrug efflux pump subunit AcrA (membrane-fusion protein)
MEKEKTHNMTPGHSFSELDRVLPRMPERTGRLGLAAILFTLILLLALAGWLNYPENIRTPVYLTTSNLPITLSAPQSGTIDQVWVKEGALVKQGDNLLLMKSPAKREHILRLEEAVNALVEWKTISELPAYAFPGSLEVGMLSPPYNALEKAFQKLKTQLEKNLLVQKIQRLEEQVRKLQELNQALTEQEKVMGRIAELALNDLTRMQGLREGAAISLLEKEKAEIDYLQYKRQQEVIKTNRINNSIRIEEIRLSQLDLQQEIEQSRREQWLNLKGLAGEIRTGIQAWKQKHLLIAPVNGKLSFAHPITAGQYTSSGNPLLTISPEKDSNEVFAYGYLPPQGEGKVRAGAKVIIQLTGLSSRQFGVIRGEVQEIAAYPGPDGRRIKIQLPAELRTSYDLKLDFQQEMQGTARIYSKDQSLLQRIINPLRAAIQNN